MSKRKILYISGTRADYGLMRKTLFGIKKHPKLTIEIAVTGMHLMPEFGKTIEQIKKDGFKVHQIGATYREDNKQSMANFIGEFTSRLSKKITQQKPDILLVMGDRAEMLAGAIVGAYLAIPVCHIHGGEITSTVDEIARQAITKLAHLHLPATKKAAERIARLGEEKWRVHLVGAPGVESILEGRFLSKKEICSQLRFKEQEPIILVIQHPLTLEIKRAREQMRQTLEAVKELAHQTVVLFPNADAGGRAMIKVIKKYQPLPFVRVFKTLEHRFYLSLMKACSVLVGNSSSGLIEAPSLKLAAVNIGSRQQERERAGNVIDVGYNKKEIKRAIMKALSKNFQKKLKTWQNPYEQRKTAEKITNFLARIKINTKLLNKKLAY